VGSEEQVIIKNMCETRETRFVVVVVVHITKATECGDGILRNKTSSSHVRMSTLNNALSAVMDGTRPLQSPYSDWLRVGRLWVGIRVPVGARILPSPCRVDCFWAPLSLLSIG
jgi:hypothetical protein